jgi:hypothetical protein
MEEEKKNIICVRCCWLREEGKKDDEEQQKLCKKRTNEAGAHLNNEMKTFSISSSLSLHCRSRFFSSSRPRVRDKDIMR